MIYDHYASVDDSRRHSIIRAQGQLYAKMLRNIPFRCAFEGGPGYGGFAHYCRNAGAAYQAVEENSELATYLNAQGFSVKTGNLRDYTAADQSYDLIVYSHVIEHIGTGKEVLEFLSKSLQWLKPAGHLLLLVPDVQMSPRQYFADYTHVFPTTRFGVRNLCMDLGTTLVRDGYYVGRWLHGWRMLGLFYRAVPWLALPTRWRQQLDCRLAISAYCLVRKA